jgi:hypothetical protein
MQTSKMGENGFSELGEMLHISRKDGEWQVSKRNCYYVSSRFCSHIYHCWEQSVWHLIAVEIAFVKWSTERISWWRLPYLPLFQPCPKRIKIPGEDWLTSHKSWGSCLAFRFIKSKKLVSCIFHRICSILSYWWGSLFIVQHVKNNVL